jgi:hypothetical protein
MIENIPEEYRELSERKAADLAGISRSTFRRRHLEYGATQTISLTTQPDGSKVIPFTEVYRVYGDVVFENLKKQTTEPENHSFQVKKNGSGPIDTTQKEPMNQKENPFLTLKLSEYMELKVGLASKEVELEQLNKRLEEQKRLIEDSKHREIRERDRADKLFEELQASIRLLEDKSSKIPQQTKSLFHFINPASWFTHK